MATERSPSHNSMSGDLNFTTNSTETPRELHVPAEWGEMVKIVATNILVAVGLVANSLTFIVMKTPRLRYKSYSHYLSAVAVFDSLVLVGQEIHIIDDILSENKQHPGLFSKFSHDSCKIFMFADAVCNLMSTWLIVAMAIERLCVVYMPFRRNMWCQQRGAVIIIISLFCVFSCTQVFRFVTTESNGMECAGSEAYYNIYLPLQVYVYQFAFLFIAPVILVLVSNVGVLLKIFKVEKATQNEDSSSTRLTGSARRRSKTTLMLVAISMTYIVTTLPMVVMTMYTYIMMQHYGNGFGETFKLLVPWMQVLQAVTNINYASNFFIYILSGKKFRIELRRIFTHDRANSFVVGSSRTRDEILMMSY